MWLVVVVGWVGWVGFLDLRAAALTY